MNTALMRLIPWVLVVLVIVLLYLAVGEDLLRVMRRRTRNYGVKYSQYLTRETLTYPILFLLLALLMRDVLVSGFLLLVGAAIGYYRVRQAVDDAAKIKISQIQQLVVSFRGAYYLQPVVFNNLREAATHITGPLREMVTASVEAYFATSSAERAFDEFRRRTDNVLLHQFVYILEMSESAANESMTQALDAFINRLRSNEELEREVETGLTQVLSEARFMQNTVMVLAFMAAVVNPLRSVWVRSMAWRLGYIVIMAIVLGVSYYVEKQILDLKGQIR